MELSTKAVILFACVTLTSSYVHALCEVGSFYKYDVSKCVQCSECPTNKIVLRQCYNDQDTLCGKWKFDFNQTPFRKDAAAEKKTNDVNVPTVKDDEQQTKKPEESLQDELMHIDDKWFTITMILVGVLVFTCVTGIVLILYMCVVCRRKNREIICDSVYTSALLRDDGQSPPKFEPFRIVTET